MTTPAVHSDKSPTRVIGVPATLATVETAVAEIFREFPLELSGRTVLVKPNMLGPHPLQHQTTTNPALVGALVRYLRSAGAQVMVGDNPGVSGYGMNEYCARKCGFIEVSEGCYVNLSTETEQIKPKSRLLKSIVVSKQVLKADMVISTPRFKTHVFTTLTGAIKNTFGYLPGANKGHLHHQFPDARTFSEAIVDIYRVRPPELTIMDAFTAMEGDGPSGGPLRELNQLIAATDGVALDTIMGWMMGVSAAKVPQLMAARALNCGNTDIDSIRIEGALQPIPNFKLPSTVQIGLISNLVNRFAFPQVNRPPHIIFDRCIRCQYCSEVCPVQAITKGDPPTIDLKRCIKCYCCVENCPSKAMQVRSSWIVETRRKWMNRIRNRKTH